MSRAVESLLHREGQRWADVVNWYQQNIGSWETANAYEEI